MKLRLSWIHLSNRVSVGVIHSETSSHLFEDEIKCACFKKC